MKLASFQSGQQASWGAVVDGGIIDLGVLTGIPTLRGALETREMEKFANLAANEKPSHDIDSVTFLPVIPDPEKILCVGTNYHDHRIETGREVPDHPVIFARYANSQVGHMQHILCPSESEQLDFEGEIAVIIGRSGRRICEADAWTYVAGYAPYCDGTIRDWQRHTHQWTPGKNFPATGGFGPWMVTRDEIEDGDNLSLVTRINGQEVQRSSASLMIFSIPRLIAYCSSFTALEPGDVIVTGTPGGVGAKRVPPLWMKTGDIVEVEVGRVGTLRNLIKSEAE